MRKIIVEKMDGLVPYKQVWEYQSNILEYIYANRKSDVAGHLIFCEHKHVFTLGKNGIANNLLADKERLEHLDAEFFHTDRGGDITYHGPGQIVGYPIFDLQKMKIGIKDYIFRIEECIIELLRKYKLKATRIDNATGIWINKEFTSEKICAIGVRVSKGISMHGFAFNINTDLNYFSYIHPCGYTDKGVTSLQKELNGLQNINEVIKKLESIIFRIFDIDEFEYIFSEK
jgi:lipoyl(octanoyl) transferase